MAVHKLHLDEFDEVDYDLIAIHSSLEDYRLAYFINQKLSVSLCKSKEEIGITVKEGEASFQKFTFDDQTNDILWSLVPNKNEISVARKNTRPNLFVDAPEDIATKVYLLPELKKVDYFLKLENNNNTLNMEDMVRDIKSINRISTVYAVIPEKIKSKNNLIF
ncbi:IPExxxVDY family protein [Flavobacterium caeni]|uniref:IPExxxVDY family protein n=1 Tax=Flavobacterium caeni TaxID=490189 RepID=A0A1G5H1K3_9FLAO|nr:IPExxxVDY family protein [Flavobacterium caeni]SCY57537.1 hypothetical protein SAMN02927903_01720 [Flavobacterium caeni]